MKLLHIETGRHLYGGAQQVLWLLEGLSRRDCDGVLVCTAGSEVEGAAAAAGIAHVALPCRGDLDPGFLRRLVPVLGAEAPAVVHCHGRRGADLWGGRAAARAGIVAVVSRRVDHREPPWLARWRYRPFARIVAISETIARALAADGIDRERIRVIRSAVDAACFADAPDRERFLEDFGLEPGAPVLFCVAQFIPRKGHSYLFEAMQRLQPRYPGLRLLLFGRGPLENDLRAQCVRLGLGDAVRFAGFRPDLDRYLGCADLLVHPALAEGLGVACLKAQAAGVPVVAFAAGGLGEAIADGATGLLVPPGDARALADAIAELLDDTARRRQFAEAGRRHMRAEFSVDGMAEAHMALYRALVHD